MKKALVTGAAGFIGSHLVELLVRADYRVVAADSLLWGDERIRRFVEQQAVELHRGDIRDEAFMAQVTDLGPFDVVYHLAALHYIPYCDAHPVEALGVNVLGTQVLLQALTLLPPLRLVFISTGDVYAPKDVPHEEGDPLEPFSVYGVSKLSGERLVAVAANKMPETTFVVARLFNAYGSGETNPHVVPDIIVQLKRGGALRLGNTWPLRDYIDVRDIGRALTILGNYSTPQKFECFNVGTGTVSSVMDIVAALQDILRTRIAIETDRQKVRPVERPRLQANIERLQRSTQWRPRYTLLDGLRDLCVKEGLVSDLGL